jgi:hypothetical protein
VTDRLVPPVGAFAARHEAMEEHGPAGAPNPAEMAFTELTPGALDQMGMPIEAGPGFRLVHGYQGVGAMLHLVYSNGRAMVSVYEQPGTVRWDDMSGSGTRMDLGGHPALDMRTGTQEVVVVDRGVRVDTLITGTDHDGLMGVAHALPEREQTVMDRVRRVVRTVVESFGGHG